MNRFVIGLVVTSSLAVAGCLSRPYDDAPVNASIELYPDTFEVAFEGMVFEGTLVVKDEFGYPMAATNVLLQSNYTDPFYYLLNPDDVDNSEGDTAAERADTVIDDSDSPEMYSLNVTTDKQGVARYYFYAKCIPTSCAYGDGTIVSSCDLADYFASPGASNSCSMAPGNITANVGSASEEVEIPSMFTVSVAAE